MDREDVDVVEAALDVVFTEPDLTCVDHYTARFLSGAFGSQEKCALAPAGELPTEAEVRRVSRLGGRGRGRGRDPQGRSTRRPPRHCVLLYQRSDPVITDLMGISFSRRPPPAGS